MKPQIKPIPPNDEPDDGDDWLPPLMGLVIGAVIVGTLLWIAGVRP